MPLSSTRKVVKQGKHLKVGTIGPQLKLDPHEENPFTIIISQQKRKFPTIFIKSSPEKEKQSKQKAKKEEPMMGCFLIMVKHIIAGKKDTDPDPKFSTQKNH